MGTKGTKKGHPRVAFFIPMVIVRAKLPPLVIANFLA